MLSFGQKRGQEKNEKVSKTLIGSWKFDYVLHGTPDMEIAAREKSQLFHTDTIHFFKDMTYKFRSHDTDFIDVRTHTGTWEITNKGKILNHKDRVAVPPFVGESPDLTFPIRVINKNRIRIDYIFFDRGDTTPLPSNTPVYFVRIK